jgi:hypothetical protein
VAILLQDAHFQSILPEQDELVMIRRVNSKCTFEINEMPIDEDVDDTVDIEPVDFESVPAASLSMHDPRTDSGNLNEDNSHNTDPNNLNVSQFYENISDGRQNKKMQGIIFPLFGMVCLFLKVSLCRILMCVNACFENTQIDDSRRNIING